MAPTSRELRRQSPASPPAAGSSARNEARWATALPARLTLQTGMHTSDMIPAIVTDLSASGFSALVDTRFSDLLPPPPGAQCVIRFFVEEIAIRGARATVVRVEQRGSQQLALGCTFMDLPAEVRLKLRTKAAARRTASTPG